MAKDSKPNDEWQIPECAYDWMTEEIYALLQAVNKGRHTRKARDTIVMVAHAIASGSPVKPVFKQRQVCSHETWYKKWKRDPVVFAAYQACIDRALSWRDEETAAIEAHWASVRRRNLAEHAAAAPLALSVVMSSAGEKGSDRIEAATRLLKFSDPELGKVQTGGSGSVDVDVVAKLDDEIVKALRALGVIDADGDSE